MLEGNPERAGGDLAVDGLDPRMVDPGVGHQHGHSKVGELVEALTVL